MPNWLLVDGSSLIFRAFYGIPQTMRAPDGSLVNAVRGFMDNLARYITERKPHRVAVATDEDWRPDWRVEILPSYKQHRVAEPVPPALIPQMSVIMRCLGAIGVDAVGLEGYEAEDIIATLVAKVDAPIEIASGDRDLFSLIRDREVIVLYPEKSGVTAVDEAEVARRYSIPGRSYSDFAILRGDPSDGLPGLAGVGPKKAADLIKRYGSIQGMLDASVFRTSDAEYLERALKVVPPVADLPLEVPMGRRDRWPVDAKAAAELGRKHGVASSIERLVKALSSMP